MIRKREFSMRSLGFPRVLVAGVDEETRLFLEGHLACGCSLFFCGVDAVFQALASSRFDGLIIDLDHIGLSVGRLLGQARSRGLGLPPRIVFLDASPNSVAPPSLGEAVLLKKPLNENALRTVLFDRNATLEWSLRHHVLGTAAAGAVAGVS